MEITTCTSCCQLNIKSELILSMILDTVCNETGCTRSNKLFFRAALSNAAPAIYFSGALRKHIIWADY
jgi:hypothetical protein